jgi:phosphoribosylglycinamide formyltransferase-1
MKRLAVFASGSGSNAENIVEYFSRRDGVEVALIVSNRKDAFVLERAKRLGTPACTFSKQEFEDGTCVPDALKAHGVDWIILAGFLLKVPESLLKAFPDRIINIHPALLPEFGGKGMYGARVHEAVAAAGRRISGITVHYVNENYDEGKIIFQASCEVLPSDTPEDIAAKVHALEYEHFPRVIEETLLSRDC